MKKSYLLPLVVLLAFSSTLGAQCPEPTWSDEFDGTALNLENWAYDINTDCGDPPCSWYNNELQQYYADNAAVKDGELTITATKAPAGADWPYNSARILTEGLQEFKYGRMEARMKVPPGRGLWPAFWMLSDVDKFGKWPLSGEIDIMEWVGREPDRLLGTIHYGRTPGVSINSSNDLFLPGDEAWSDNYHTYAIEWSENSIKWFVDDYLYGTETPSSISPQAWPFRHEFFFILNLAVGGDLGGPVDGSIFPAEMKVDFVRVYKDSKPYLQGPNTVSDINSLSTYSVEGLDPGAAVQWTLPAGASITGGAGTKSITVNWGSATSGNVEATFEGSCGEQKVRVNVVLASAKTFARSLENFDDASELSVSFASGPLTVVDNPDKSGVNTSELVGRYQRDGASQYDVLVYTLPNLPNAAGFTTGDLAFFMDVYTDAPAGTEILLQLETAAAGDNYPVGRHSRYSAKVGESDGWERLVFAFVDKPDGSARPTSIKQMVVLFAPNSMTSDVYHFDNLDIYSAEPLGVSSALPEVGQLTVRPNPVAEQLQLELTLKQPQQIIIEVVDGAGRVLLHQQPVDLGIGRAIQSIDTSGLPSGRYEAVVRSSGRQSTVSFVKG